jgi:hypothetical protein
MKHVKNETNKQTNKQREQLNGENKEIRPEIKK